MLHAPRAHMQRTDQKHKADAGDQRKKKHDGSPIESAFERQRVEQTPTAGPAMLAIWKTVAPQVMAFTKCSVDTRWGNSAELAGPLNARPDPIRNSTAKIGPTLCSPRKAKISRVRVQRIWST